MQLRFGTRLKAYVEFHAVAHNLLDHRAHLVHLYRVDDEVFRFIAVLFCRFAETVGDFFDSVVKNIRKAQKHRCGHIAHLQLVHDLLEVYGGMSVLGRYGNVSFVIDGEIFEAPSVYIVQLSAVFYAPFSHICR